MKSDGTLEENHNIRMQNTKSIPDLGTDEKEYQATWNSYLQEKEKVENCLTTLKRDKQLKKLFEQNLEDSK